MNQKYKRLYQLILFIVFLWPYMAICSDTSIPRFERSICMSSGKVIEECTFEDQVIDRREIIIPEDTQGKSQLTEMKASSLDEVATIDDKQSVLSAAPGAKKWEFEVSGIPEEAVVGSDGTIYLAHQEGLYAINPDGTQKWALKFSGTHLGPVLDEARQTIYVYSFDLFAISFDGTIKWQKSVYDLTGQGNSCYKSSSSGLEVGSDGTIYLGVRPFLVAVNPTGVKKWIFRQGPESWQYFDRPAVGSDGTIYSGSDDGNLYAIDTNGNEKWHFNTDGDTFFQPAVSTDNQVIYFTSGSYLYALQTSGALKWKANIGSSSGSPVIGNDGIIYTVSSAGLYAFFTNGNEKWHAAGVFGYYSTPSLKNNLIYFASLYNGLYSFDTNGNQKWLYPVDGYCTSKHCPVNGSGQIFIASQKTGSLYSVNSLGNEIWSFEAKGSPIYTSPAIDHAGNVYLSADNGWLYKLDGNGNQLWKKYEGDGLSATIGTDNTVYIGSRSYVISAFNPNGSNKWRYTTADYYNSSPSIDNAGNLYFSSGSFGVGTNNHVMTLHSITVDGQARWNHTLGDAYDSLSLPAIGYDGTIYVIDGQSKLSAFSSGGTVQWKYVSGIATLAPSSPIIGNSGEIVYNAPYNGPLLSINSNGTLKWSCPDHHALLGQYFAIGSGGRLFAGGTEFYSLSPTSGATLWQTPEDDETSGYTAPAVGDDGTIYSGSYDGYLYAFGSSSGIKWRFAADGKIYSPPALGTDGTLYFGDETGKFYAIQSSSKKLAETAWPMFGNNAQHTGKSSTVPVVSMGGISMGGIYLILLNQ